MKSESTDLSCGLPKNDGQERKWECKLLHGRRPLKRRVQKLKKRGDAISPEVGKNRPDEN